MTSAAPEPTDEQPTAVLDVYDQHLADDLWQAIADVRDAHPRRADDAETWDLVATAAPIIARALAAAVAAEREKYLRVAEELKRDAMQYRDYSERAKYPDSYNRNIGSAATAQDAARRIREVSR